MRAALSQPTMLQEFPLQAGLQAYMFGGGTLASTGKHWAWLPGAWACKGMTGGGTCMPALMEGLLATHEWEPAPKGAKGANMWGLGIASTDWFNELENSSSPKALSLNLLVCYFIFLPKNNL